MSEKILVSACLAGFPCRYDGKPQTDPETARLVKCGLALAFCAECSGGLPTPRTPAQIVGGSGEDVLEGRARVIAYNGIERTDVTAPFIEGAKNALAAARRIGAEKAVLKANSPSCGCGIIYDGSFTGAKKPGNGVTAALLIKNGIEVKSV